MEYLETLVDTVSIHIGDLPASAVENAGRVGLVAWDIETSGLNWRADQIGTCQVYVPEVQVYIVRINNKPRPQLEKLLKSPNVCKVFHHAMFDLRFMVHQWSVEVQNVACTKIASKILNPLTENHSLKNILQQHLDISIDKGLRNSDWLSMPLTKEQVSYATKDVIYLPKLFETLRDKLVTCRRWSIAQACFKFIPVQVQLEILGCVNVFQY